MPNASGVPMQTSSSTSRITDGQAGRGKPPVVASARMYDARIQAIGQGARRRRARPPRARAVPADGAVERVRERARLVEDGAREAANVSICSSAPITADSAEASSSTMPTATRSSCCRASARRHIVASRLRPPCGPRLIPLTIGRAYSPAPCALAVIALLAPRSLRSAAAERARGSAAGARRRRVDHRRARSRRRPPAALAARPPRDRVADEAHDGAPRAAVRAPRRRSSRPAATPSRSASRAFRSRSASARPCTRCWRR